MPNITKEQQQQQQKGRMIEDPDPSEGKCVVTLAGEVPCRLKLLLRKI